MREGLLRQEWTFEHLPKTDTRQFNLENPTGAMRARASAS